MALPRTPRATPLFSFAVVAGDFRPSNDPAIDSVVPGSVADAEPLPAIVARMPPSIGTVARRTLYRSGACEEAGAASDRRLAHTAIRM